ncbi:DUF4269 domain-containing protein [Sphingobacterium sp. LRF_L2]|uniref:DUF4269 domain-containing protein n=1 Tax=Sphingobacterium sp. LRF_L2 TaxID=3369421 RepID=UPI003F62EEEC
MKSSVGEHFDDIGYLALGTSMQQMAYNVLVKYDLLLNLEAYDAILVGTVPLDIAIASSDLDIVCYVEDFSSFTALVHEKFANYPAFCITNHWIDGEFTVLVNFRLEMFEIEIFGQFIPVKKQNGFMHMLKEYEILTMYGQEFKEKVIALKRAGVKTEPAFAKLLGISGDPYSGLLKYKITNEEF